MLIPLDYRSEDVLRQHEQIWQIKRPGWSWPLRHSYTIEYSWACDRLREYLRVRPSWARVMDAGGGKGSMQHYLAANYREAWNVDTEPGHLHVSLRPSILLQADLESPWIAQPSSFDAILSVSAIEHNPWEKILKIIRNLLGLLRPKAPLIVTVPAFQIAHYYPYRGWPEPQQAKWPECYGFDTKSLQDVFAGVSDMAQAIEPKVLPSSEAYRRQWTAQYNDMMTNSPEGSRHPYLSTGFVLLRK